MASSYTYTFQDRINEKYMSESQRIYKINVVRDLRNGDSFAHYLNKFYLAQNADIAINDEAKKKMYITHNNMESIVRNFVSYCPNLKEQMVRATNKTKEKKKKELIKQFKVLNDWDNLIDQIYDTMEAKGDAFLYYYFETEDSKIPKLKLLRSEDLLHITVDEFDNPKTYVYRETIWDEKVNLITGNIQRLNHHYTTWCFQKGLTSRSIIVETEQGEKIVDENGEVEIKEYSVANRDYYKNEFSVIHIPTYKKQFERFSKIPADDYIDFCLQLDQISSDIRATNRQFSFPKQRIIDGTFVGGSGEVGGIMIAETSPDALLADKQAKIQDFQLQNGLDSAFKEHEDVTEKLYNMAGLPSPKMLRDVGKSDSSKVFQQLNMRTEQKIEKYINNIIEAFKPVFKVLFMENGLYEDKFDYGYSWEKPENIIRRSSYDEKLNLQLDLLNGQTSMTQALRDKGYTDKEIKVIMEEITKEQNNGKNDVSKQVKAEVENANNSVATEK